MQQTLTTYLAPFLVSLTTLTGVTLHETKLDKLAVSTVALPVTPAATDTGIKNVMGDPHTHVERVSLREMRSVAPSLAPRHGDHKRHLLQKGTPRGNHYFDQYGIYNA